MARLRIPPQQQLDASDLPRRARKLRYNYYGFTIGGPVWIPNVYNTDKKKDFFFFSTEFSREIRGNTVTDTVPTQGQRNGIFQTPCVTGGPGCDPQEFAVNEPNFTGTPDPNAVAFLARAILSPIPDISNGFNFIASRTCGEQFQPLRHPLGPCYRRQSYLHGQLYANEHPTRWPQQ
jgi:hypothetical protein